MNMNGCQICSLFPDTLLKQINSNIYRKFIRQTRGQMAEWSRRRSNKRDYECSNPSSDTFLSFF